MSDPYETILVETRGRVRLITLNRPNQRNAQNKQLLVELDRAWDMAAEDNQVKVIVLKANGPHQEDILQLGFWRVVGIWIHVDQAQERKT